MNDTNERATVTLSVLVVDDDESIRDTLVEYFATIGFTARGAASAAEGRRLAREHAPDVVLLDLRLPDDTSLATLDALLAEDADLAVVVLTGFADVRTAVNAMHRGAADVLEKPVDLDSLRATVVRAAERGRLRQEVAVLRARARVEGERESTPAVNPSLDQLIHLAARNADAPVLLQGETGTGKGFVARLIHDRSSRHDAPFVEINCASLSTTFFESELFGHERGAFTDARQAKRGLLEVAGAGTVFLDEIAEMAADVQPRFLKVLEDRSFRRLGGTTTLRSAARVIVATHVPLADALASQRLRADLYYRLQVLTITLAPLRARVDEIVPLARTFLPRGASLSVDAEHALASYSWPGNVRELKNTIWRASILADSTTIRAAHLGLSEHQSALAPRPTSTAAPSIRASEIDTIRRALDATGGNRSRAARQLGIARSTLLEKIKRYQL